MLTPVVRNPIACALLILSTIVHPLASRAASPQKTWILADTVLLLTAGIPVLDHEVSTGVALAEIDSFEEKRLALAAHANGKCGGFERLPSRPWLRSWESRELARAALLDLAHASTRADQRALPHLSPVLRNHRIEKAVSEVDPSQLRRTVEWLSRFPTRYHRGPTPNVHVEEMKARLEALVSKAPWQAQISTISHRGTAQNSLRLRIEGSTSPDEIVVLGGHLDSINHSWGQTRAPGADDNASGSSNLYETLRILTTQPQPRRTIEFFWYAGEEGGLIGSAEIARDYAERGRNVIGVLQLDMTLFPGDGKFVLGSMTDFTSPALRRWFAELNRTYIGGTIIDDQCGYACSDHASWHRQGYPAIMPFESTGENMFPDLHTTRDVISSQSSFEHSAMFAKIAVAFAMELGGY